MGQRGKLEAKLLVLFAVARGPTHHSVCVLLSALASASATVVTSLLAFELFALPLITDALGTGTLRLPYPQHEINIETSSRVVLC